MDVADVRAFIDGQRQAKSQTVMVNLPTGGGDGLITSVPSETPMRGAVSVPGGAKGGIPSLSLAVRGPQGVMLAMVDVTKWPLEEQIESFNRAQDNKRKDEEADGRITLDVQALYGAIWLGDGTGLNEIGPASLSGLGVRVGINTTVSG